MLLLLSMQALLPLHNLWCVLSRVWGSPSRSRELFSSRDGAPGAIVGVAAASADSLAPSASSEDFWCPRTTSLSCPVARSSDQDLFSIPWLARAIPSLRTESPPSGGGCRYCDPALLASTSTSAVVVLTVDHENASSRCSGKNAQNIAADMVRPPRSQNLPAAASDVAAAAVAAAAVAAAVAAAAPGRAILARVAAVAAAADAVFVAPGRSIAVAGQTAAAVVVAPGRSIAVAAQTAAAADAVAAR